MTRALRTLGRGGTLAAMEVPTDQTAQNISETINELDNFCSDGKLYMKNYLRHYQETFRENEKKINVLNQQKRNLTQTIEYSQAEREKERNEIETLQAELKALKLERDVAPKQLEKLAFELAEKEKAFGEKNESYMKQEDEIDQRFAHLKKAVATYESRLGLDISILGTNTIRFIFTKVDVAVPDRKFIIELGTQKKNTYKVTHCQPVIDYEKPLEEFNKTKDYRIFFIAIRKLFKSRI